MIPFPSLHRRQEAAWIIPVPPCPLVLSQYLSMLKLYRGDTSWSSGYSHSRTAAAASPEPTNPLPRFNIMELATCCIAVSLPN